MRKPPAVCFCSTRSANQVHLANTRSLLQKVQHIPSILSEVQCDDDNVRHSWVSYGDWTNNHSLKKKKIENVTQF